MPIININRLVNYRLKNPKKKEKKENSNKKIKNQKKKVVSKGRWKWIEYFTKCCIKKKRKKRKDSYEDQDDLITDGEDSNSIDQDVESKVDEIKDEGSWIDTYEPSSRNSNNEDNNIDYNNNKNDILVELFYQSKKENKTIPKNFPTIFLCLKELVDLDWRDKSSLLREILTQIDRKKRINEVLPLTNTCDVIIDDKSSETKIVMVFSLDAGLDFTKDLKILRNYLSEFFINQPPSNDFRNQIDTCELLSPEPAGYVKGLLQRMFDDSEMTPTEMLKDPLIWTDKEKIDFVCSFQELLKYIPPEKRKPLELDKDGLGLFGNPGGSILVLLNGYHIKVFLKSDSKNKETCLDFNKILVFKETEEYNKNSSITSLKWEWKVESRVKFDEYKSVKENKSFILRLQENGELLIWKSYEEEDTILNKLNCEEFKLIDEEEILVVIHTKHKDNNNVNKNNIHLSLDHTFIYGGFVEIEVEGKTIKILNENNKLSFSEKFTFLFRNRWIHIASNSWEKEDINRDFILGLFFGFGADGRSDANPEIFLERILKVFPGFISHLYYNCNEKVMKAAEDELKKKSEKFRNCPKKVYEMKV